MSTFYPVAMNDESFIKGPGRLLYAAMSTAFPTGIGDVVNLSTYAAQAGWTDIGATKDGIQITFNNSEEAYDIDQVLGNILTLPTGVEMFVQTALSQATLDWLSFAWEGSPVTTNAVPAIPEKQVGFGPFESYTQRRLAIGYRRPSSGKIRLHVFRRTNRAPQESSITYNKTGAQQTLPMRWTVLPDTSIAVTRQQFGLTFDQVTTAPLGG